MPTIPGGWELLLIVLLIMLMFGFKRLPAAARDLGQSLRILREETEGPEDRRAQRASEP